MPKQMSVVAPKYKGFKIHYEVDADKWFIIDGGTTEAVSKPSLSELYNYIDGIVSRKFNRYTVLIEGNSEGWFSRNEKAYTRLTVTSHSENYDEDISSFDYAWTVDSKGNKRQYSKDSLYEDNAVNIKMLNEIFKLEQEDRKRSNDVEKKITSIRKKLKNVKLT